MRIVVDSNIAFSAILNSNSKIGRIILHPRSRLNFYSTNQLLAEIEEHKNKLKSISGYSDMDLDHVIRLIIYKIRFIDVKLIPIEIFQKALMLTQDVDIDDTEFVALTEHAKAKLWTGDKKLIQGMVGKNWKKVISTEELFATISKKK